MTDQPSFTNNTDLWEAIRHILGYCAVPEPGKECQHLSTSTEEEAELDQIMRLSQDRDKALAERLLAAGPKDAEHTKNLGKDYGGYSRGYNRSNEKWRKAITEVLNHE